MYYIENWFPKNQSCWKINFSNENIQEVLRLKSIHQSDVQEEGNRIQESLTAIKEICKKHKGLRQIHLKNKFLGYYESLSVNNKARAKEKSEVILKEEIVKIKNSSEKLSQSNIIEESQRIKQNDENNYNIAKKVGMHSFTINLGFFYNYPIHESNR